MTTAYSVLKRLIPRRLRTFIRDLDSAYHKLEQQLDEQIQQNERLKDLYENTQKDLQYVSQELEDANRKLQQKLSKKLDSINFDYIIEEFVNRQDFGTKDFCDELYNAIVSDSLTEETSLNHRVKRICILIAEDIRYFYPTIKLVADIIAENGISVDIFCLDSEKQDELESRHHFKIINYQTTQVQTLFNYHHTKAGKLEFLAQAITQIKMYDAYIGLNEIGLAAAYFLAKRIYKKPLIAYMLEIPSIKEDFDRYIDSLFKEVDGFVDVDPGRLNYRITNLQVTKTNFYIRNLPRQKEANAIEKIQKYASDSKVVLWYHGTISRFHGIKEILDGYYRSKFVQELYLTGPFLLQEDQRQLLERIAAENKPVFIHEPVPRDVVLKRAAELASIAICFYPFRDSNPQDYIGRLYANPAKVFDYMALGIPTITSDNPSLVEYVQNEGWGVCVSPEDADAVAEVMDLLAQDEARRVRMSQQAKQLFESKYNLAQEVKPFISWLNSYLKA